MKRLLVVLLPVLLLAGCAAPTPEDAYVSVVREGVPALADAGTAELTKLGHQVCGILEDRGFEDGMVEFIRIAKGAGLTPAEAGRVAGAASVAYCDDYADEF